MFSLDKLILKSYFPVLYLTAFGPSPASDSSQATSTVASRKWEIPFIFCLKLQVF